jgi:hypothetical protein
MRRVVEKHDVAAIEPLVCSVAAARRFSIRAHAGVDGTVLAYDDQTLDELWRINVDSGFNAPPMTYAVNGKQYIAIASGLCSAGPGAAPLRNTRGRVNRTPELRQQGNAMVVVPAQDEVEKCNYDWGGADEYVRPLPRRACGFRLPPSFRPVLISTAPGQHRNARVRIFRASQCCASSATPR